MGEDDKFENFDQRQPQRYNKFSIETSDDSKASFAQIYNVPFPLRNYNLTVDILCGRDLHFEETEDRTLPWNHKAVGYAIDGQLNQLEYAAKNGDEDAVQALEYLTAKPRRVFFIHCHGGSSDSIFRVTDINGLSIPFNDLTKFVDQHNEHPRIVQADKRYDCIYSSACNEERYRYTACSVPLIAQQDLASTGRGYIQQPNGTLQPAEINDYIFIDKAE